MTVRVPTQAPFEEETAVTLQKIQVLHCCCLEWRYPLLDLVLQEKHLAVIFKRHPTCMHTHEAPEQDGLQGACYNYGFMQVNMDNYGFMQVVICQLIPLFPSLESFCRKSRADDESPFIHDSIQKLFTPWCMYAYSQPP